MGKNKGMVEWFRPELASRNKKIFLNTVSGAEAYYLRFDLFVAKILRFINQRKADSVIFSKTGELLAIQDILRKCKLLKIDPEQLIKDFYNFFEDEGLGRVRLRQKRQDGLQENGMQRILRDGSVGLAEAINRFLDVKMGGNQVTRADLQTSALRQKNDQMKDENNQSLVQEILNAFAAEQLSPKQIREFLTPQESDRFNKLLTLFRQGKDSFDEQVELSDLVLKLQPSLLISLPSIQSLGRSIYHPDGAREVVLKPVPPPTPSEDRAFIKAVIEDQSIYLNGLPDPTSLNPGIAAAQRRLNKNEYPIEGATKQG